MAQNVTFQKVLQYVLSTKNSGLEQDSSKKLNNHKPMRVEIGSHRDMHIQLDSDILTAHYIN